MTDPLAIIYVLLMGAVLASAVVFDARRRRGRRIQAGLAAADAGRAAE